MMLLFTLNQMFYLQLRLLIGLTGSPFLQRMMHSGCGSSGNFVNTVLNGGESSEIPWRPLL